MKNIALYISTIIAMLLITYASLGHAAIQCYHCHGTPNPIDFRPTDSSFRNSSSGGFQGNHRTHLTSNASPASCTICHPGSDSYTASHRNGFIKVLISSKKSVLAAKYKNSTSAWAQTSEPDLDTCTSVNCHFGTQTPTWGNPAFNSTGECTKCHEGTQPLSASHVTHKRYSTGLMGKFSSYAACATCHVNYVTPPNFIHATSAGNHPIIVSVGGYNSGSMTFFPSQSHGAFGSCSNLYCHSTGKRASTPFASPNQIATWGSSLRSDCSGCHKGSATSFNWMTSGSHDKHVYSYNRIDCVKCHSATVNSGLSIRNVSRHVNGTVEVAFNSTTSAVNGKYNGSFAPVAKTPGTAYGSCDNVYCHSNAQNNGGTGITYKQPVWGTASTGSCGKCHEVNASHNGSPEISSGSHAKHLSYDSITNSGAVKCTQCHNLSGAPFNPLCNTQCHAGGSIAAKHANHQINIIIPTFLGYSARYNGSPNPGSGYSNCSNTYCHSNGTAVSIERAPANTSPTWGSGTMACNGCHGNKTYSDYRKAFPLYTSNRPNTKANSHKIHTAYSCEKCHNNTTTNGLTIASQVTHVNKFYDVNFGPGTSFTYSYNIAGGTCNSISCHGTTNARWGSTSCLGCHSVVQGNRVAITSQFGANSHHIQGTVTDAKCYQCHWEANSDGTINTLYHGGSPSPGSAVDLVIHGVGTRPTTYISSGFVDGISNAGGGTWTKNAPVVINNSGNSALLVNYQVKIPVTYVSGMKNDFSDLRFSDGIVELPYFIQNYTTSTSATVWVKVPSIPGSSSTTIYMYYGNPSATSSSNASATLIPNLITALEGDCTNATNCSNMDNHTEANAIRTYPANIGTRTVSKIYWGSVWDGSSPGSYVRDNFFSRFRYLFIPDTTGSWEFAVDSDDGSELILNPDDRTNPSGESVIASWYGGHGWANSQAYSGSTTLTVNQSYWMDYLHQDSGGGEAAVLWAKRPGDIWKNLSAQNYPNSIFSRKYTSPEPTPTIGAEQAVNVTGSKATAVQYTANNSRKEIQKVSYSCLGCHSDQNNGSTPFGDGKTPKQYAWDGTSVAARYTQSGTTAWGKYTDGRITPKYTQTKAFSAHGNAGNNQGGWDLNETWPDTRSTLAIACYDCHNSHGSTVAGTTTRYASATINGGILKDTIAGKGGYGVTYKPYSGGSSSNKDKRNAGASLCLDCHMTKDAGATPWGYGSTFGATQKILGYWDSPFMGYTTAGAEQRYPFKKKNPTKGGHFGASSALSSTPTGTIGGLCTPCHDPHGVSPTLGSQQQYAVPLLKGTWLTSPYKEDTAPATAGAPADYPDQNGLGVASYSIDQNTFGSNLGGTIPASTFKNVTTSGGLCLSCHPKNSLTDGTTHTWKSKDRIHESVNGWKTANGTIKHNYSCSKCHSAHTNAVLPRLMVTDCLDSRHKGRSGHNEFAKPADGTSRSGAYGDGSGSGRIPGVYAGYGTDGNYAQAPGGTSPKTFSVTCHESPSANNGANSNLDQSWNVKTPWNDIGAPTLISGAAGNTQVTISWIAGVGSTSSILKYGTATGAYGAPIDPVTSPKTITGLVNGVAIYYRVGAKSGSGTITWSAEYVVTPNVPLPAAPTNIVATPGNEQVIFSWTAGAGATSSLIRYGTTSGYYYSVIDPASTGYTAIWLTNSQTYYYQIGAKNGAGITWSSESTVIPAPPLPSTPTAITATRGNGQMTLSWAAGVGSTSSLIRYGTTSGVYATTIDSAVSGQTITGLVNGTAIYYQIGAKNITGTTWSVEASITPSAAAPSAATGISATAGRGQATFTWTAGTNSTSSLIRYGTAAGVYTTTINSAISGQTVSSLVNGTTIFYQIGASNVSGTTWSAEYNVTPSVSAPSAATGISAVPGNAQATFTWIAGASSTSSLIRYGTATGVYGTTINPGVTGQTIRPLANGTTIYYQVGAQNGSGTTWSAEYNVTPSASAPSAATGISAVAGNAQATLTWAAGTNSTSSLIRYGTATGVYVTTINPAVTGQTIRPLVNETAIYYQIGAKNLSGTTWSAEASVTPTAAAPQAPSGITGTPGDTNATISWTDGAGTTSALIRYGTTTGVYLTTIDPATTGLTISGLINGQNYYYQVGNKNGSGTTWSSENSVTPAPAVTSPPTSINATPGNTQATFSWVPGNGSISSLLRYGTSTGVYLTTIDPAVTGQTISGLANGTTIFYQIGARYAGGPNWSSEFSVTPTASAPLAPTAVSAIPGNTQVTISWTAGAGSTSSLVRYGTVTGAYVTTINSAVSGQIISSLVNGTTIYYQVGAANGSGTTWSSENSVTAGAPQSATPSGPTGTNYTDCSVSTKVMTYSWNASPSPNVDYQIQVDNDPNFGSIDYVSAWQAGTSWSQDTAQGTWYWRVLTKDRDTSLATWSNIMTYTLSYGGDCGGSCPMLFTWDGEKFVFETDLFPRGSLGRKYSNGYQKPNPNDYYLLRNTPEIREDGLYDLRLTGERLEVDYLDNIKLYTLDIPQNRDLYSEIHFTGTSYVKPETLLRTVDKQLKHPVSIKHVDTGKDVSDLLAASDEKYLVLSKDKNNDFNWQTVELDLGDLSQASQIKLIFNARTAFFTTPAGSARARKLDSKGRRTRIEVLDAHGKWVEVPPSTKELPIPKEFRRDFVVDISGIFLTSNYKVRLSFLNKTYIDAIYLDTTKDEPIKITEVPFESGTLNYYGLSARTNPGEAYGYSYGFKIDNKTSYLPGYYTRLGDVTPLLTQTDDKFVILGMGDELRLKFKEATGIPKNSSRKFMVYTNGYYKTVKFDVPHTVEPLPFAGMSNFPYDEAVEHYPMDDEHNRYRQKYNTRKQGKTNEAACCTHLPEVKTAHAAEITIVPQNAGIKEQPLAAKPVEKEVIVLESKKSPDSHALPMQWFEGMVERFWHVIASILVWFKALFAW